MELSLIGARISIIRKTWSDASKVLLPELKTEWDDDAIDLVSIRTNGLFSLDAISSNSPSISIVTFQCLCREE